MSQSLAGQHIYQYVISKCSFPSLHSYARMEQHFFRYVRQLLTKHTTQSVRHTIKQVVHRCFYSQHPLLQHFAPARQIPNCGIESYASVESKYHSIKDVLQLDISAEDADTDTNTHLELVVRTNPTNTTLPTPAIDPTSDSSPSRDVNEKQNLVSAPTPFVNITVATGYLTVPLFLLPPPIPPVFFHSGSSISLYISLSLSLSLYIYIYIPYFIE